MVSLSKDLDKTKFGGSDLVPEGTTIHLTKLLIFKSLRILAFFSASNLVL